MSGGDARFTLREMTRTALRFADWRLGMLSAAVVALAVLGPFGTFNEFTLAGRLAYWGGLILCGWVIFQCLLWIGLRVVRGRRWPWQPMVGLVVVLSAALVSVVVAAVEVSAGVGRLAPPLSPTDLFPYVLLITALVSAGPVWLVLRREGLIDQSGAGGSLCASDPASRPVDKTARSPFLDRIPPAITGDLLALTMEDHYIRIYTNKGDALVLMRMRDAVAELTGVDGLQVHRSHWVAGAAVVGWRRDGVGRVTLRLSNGLMVPVSRARLGAVRAAGWTDPRRALNNLLG